MARRRTDASKSRKKPSVLAKRYGQGIRRSLVSKSRQPHFHIRWDSNPRNMLLNPTNNGTTSVAYAFKLQDVQNVAELTSLYDSYKITKVILHLNWSPLDVPASTINNDRGNPELYGPILSYLRDYDDDTALTLGEFRERASNKQIRMKPGVQYKIALTPAVAQEIYRAGALPAYAAKWKQRLDMANDDVPHYGIKLLATYLAGGFDLGTINIRTQYYITCYNTR